MKKQKLSYIELINRFWEYYSIKRISDIDTTMYFYLLNECNIRRWLNPFELQTRNLEAGLQISRKTITEARNRLKQRGLIDFMEARGRRPTVYLLEGVDVSNVMLMEYFGVSLEKHEGNTRVTQEKHEGNTRVTPSDFSPIILEDIKTIDRERRVRACESFFDEIFEDIFSDEKRKSLESFCMQNRVTVEEAKEVAREVITEWRLAEIAHESADDARRHLVYLMRIKINSKRNENNKADRLSRRRGTEPDTLDREGFDSSF